MSDIEEKICEARKTAYGLSACHECPVGCSMSSQNSNQLENVKCTIEKLEKKYASK